MDCPPADHDRTADTTAEVRVDATPLDLDGTNRDAELTTVDVDAALDVDLDRTDLGVDETLVDLGALREE